MPNGNAAAGFVDPPDPFGTGLGTSAAAVPMNTLTRGTAPAVPGLVDTGGGSVIVGPHAATNAKKDVAHASRIGQECLIAAIVAMG
jgi:acyl-[acyl carrier protein]--UDP-N-acetylglucosamine O-acyltransferase